MALAPGNGLLAFGDNAGNITLWNYRTNDKHTIQAFPGSPIQHVAFNADGSLLAVSAGVLPANGAAPANQDSNIHVYDAQILANGIVDPLVMTVVGPTQTVTGLAFSPDSRMLVAVAADRTFWLWGIADNTGAAVNPPPVIVPTSIADAPGVQPSGCVNNFFVAGAVGCSDASSITTSAAYQGFQNGFMLWLGDTKSILVLYNDGSGNMYSDTWVNQMIITNSAPPDGLLTPDHGFGWVWMQNPAIKDKIGWATGVEVPYSIQYQTGHVDSPGPRPPGLGYYTLPGGMGAPIEVTFYDGGLNWRYLA
jgi:WD40 repeat protein